MPQCCVLIMHSATALIYGTPSGKFVVSSYMNKIGFTSIHILSPNLMMRICYYKQSKQVSWLTRAHAMMLNSSEAPERNVHPRNWAASSAWRLIQWTACVCIPRHAARAQSNPSRSSRGEHMRRASGCTQPCTIWGTERDLCKHIVELFFAPLHSVGFSFRQTFGLRMNYLI